MGLDLNQQQDKIESSIKALKDYNETSNAEKEILKKGGNSFSKVASGLSSQLNKISEQQKRYQREQPTSLDRMVDLLTTTKGSGPETFKFLRKLLLQTTVTIEPKINEILSQEVIKALGCSQEQTYNSISTNNLQVPSLELLPKTVGNYVPLESIDLTGMLKLDVNSVLGKMFYENDVPSTSDEYVPYGGKIKFPVNRMLRGMSLSPGQTYNDYYGKYYFGKSGKNLFDLSFTESNSYDVTGSFFRMFLLDRETSTTPQGYPINQVGQFIKDYYSTIRLVDFSQVMAVVINYMIGFVSIKGKIGVGEIDIQSKFALLLQRILGLCFDDRREIDVSGISKIGELDGVDDSFFEFNEIDLRNIEAKISNIQQGVAVFQDCDNVKLPVDADTIFDEIARFASQSSGKTNDELVNSMDEIVESIFAKWKLLVPNSAALEVSVNKDFIKNLPIALASAVLSPKALLPLFVMLNEVQRGAINELNNAISGTNDVVNSANEILQSGTTIGQQVDNVVSDSIDFIKKYKSFIISVVTKIGAIFIETLFELLKVEIFNLLTVIIRDIQRTQTAKQYAIILKLVQLGYVIARFVGDYRKCKSLLDEISLLLNLISSYRGNSIFRIPSFLNLLAFLLPGFSPERATLNTLQQLQKLGIPTGTLPGGEVNLMNLFVKSVITGIDAEESENGKVETAVKLPPPFGLISTVGKKI
ncbi:MAG: hypothetical protein RI943_748 [Bacteroidota bacterium]|jgi:hypothetical protein